MWEVVVVMVVIMVVIGRLLRNTNILCKQMLCRMVDVVIGKARHCVVTVIVVGLESDVDAFLLTDLLGSSDEVLG